MGWGVNSHLQRVCKHFHASHHALLVQSKCAQPFVDLKRARMSAKSEATHGTARKRARAEGAALAGRRTAQRETAHAQYPQSHGQLHTRRIDFVVANPQFLQSTTATLCHAERGSVQPGTRAQRH